MATIDIVRTDDGRVAFEPKELEVMAGDAVMWRNLDLDESHWITKVGEANTFFFDAPLAPFDGVTADVSGEVLVANAFDYCCALHEEELGRISIEPASLLKRS